MYCGSSCYVLRLWQGPYRSRNLTSISVLDVMFGLYGRFQNADVVGFIYGCISFGEECSAVSCCEAWCSVSLCCVVQWSVVYHCDKVKFPFPVKDKCGCTINLHAVLKGHKRKSYLETKKNHEWAADQKINRPIQSCIDFLASCQKFERYWLLYL